MDRPDSYMAIRILLHNDSITRDTNDGKETVYEDKWYDVCRKSLFGLGNAGVASIDFHMVA